MKKLAIFSATLASVLCLNAQAYPSMSFTNKSNVDMYYTVSAPEILICNQAGKVLKNSKMICKYGEQGLLNPGGTYFITFNANNDPNIYCKYRIYMLNYEAAPLSVQGMYCDFSDTTGNGDLNTLSSKK